MCFIKCKVCPRRLVYDDDLGCAGIGTIILSAKCYGVGAGLIKDVCYGVVSPCTGIERRAIVEIDSEQTSTYRVVDKCNRLRRATIGVRSTNNQSGNDGGGTDQNRYGKAIYAALISGDELYIIGSGNTRRIIVIHGTVIGYSINAAIIPIPNVLEGATL